MRAAVLGPTERRSPGLASAAWTAAVVGATLSVALLATTKGAELWGAGPILAGALVVVPVWMVATKRHHYALAVVLLYLGLVDGYVKLKAPEGNEWPGLGRDLLLYAIAVGMVVRGITQKRQLAVPPLTAWVLAFVAVTLVQLLNPANSTFVHSVTSLRQHLEFIPLFFISYSVMRSPARLRGFLLLLLVVAAINGVVSSVQFNMSPDQLGSWGPGYAELYSGDSESPRTAEGAPGESRTRPPGLGSDMGFGGTIGGIALPGALALLAMRTGRRDVLLVAPLAMGAVVAVATSNSRSAVVGAVVGLLAFLVLGTSARQILKMVVCLVVVGAVSVVALSQVDSSDGKPFRRYESIVPSQLFQTSVEERRNTYSKSLPEYLVKYPLGAGIGMAGPAAGVFGGAEVPLNAESQFTFLIVELGILGLLVLSGFHARLLSMIVPRLRKLADRDLRLMLAAVTAPLFMFLAGWFFGINTTSTPNAPYLWFAAGTLLYWLGPGTRGVQTPGTGSAA